MNNVTELQPRLTGRKISADDYSIDRETRKLIDDVRRQLDRIGRFRWKESRPHDSSGGSSLTGPPRSLGIRVWRSDRP